MPKPGSEERIDQPPEGLGPVRDLVLGVGIHLAKGLLASIGQEHRIIAEAAFAARRPDQRPMHLAFEILDMAVGPGDLEHADEMGAAPLWRRGACGLQLFLDIAHGEREVFGRSRPAC
jgi:hypothetical protein